MDPDIENRYQYPHPQQNRYELWCQCPTRSCTVYLEFLDGWESILDVRRALKAAREWNTCAVRMTRNRPASSENPGQHCHFEFSICEFKPYQPQFNSDFAAVDHTELIDVKQLKDNVKVVSFRGEQFVYKFMTPRSHQMSFETEVKNYEKLTGATRIPTLRAVVRKAGLIQGLLISYIEGLDLWDLVENGEFRDEEQLLEITYKVIHITADLEQLDFYHEDLKCRNLVRREADGELYFIDFGGGFTEGMFRDERYASICYNGPDASDALFTLGRTLWELWVAESPWKGAPLERVQNEIARNIIRDCEETKVENIIRLSKRYCPRHSGA